MAWFDSAWTYRKAITITGQSGAGAGYQVLLKIGDASGGDFNLGGNSANFPAAKNDGGDFRFTGDDGETELGFWVEKVVSGVAHVWVKVLDSLDSNQDIYIYYNNGAASNGSDGDATFELFDDFNTAPLNSTKWAVVEGGASGTSRVNSVEGTHYDVNASSNSKFRLIRNGGEYDNLISNENRNFGVGYSMIFGNTRVASTSVGTHTMGMGFHHNGHLSIDEASLYTRFMTRWNYSGSHFRHKLTVGGDRVTTPLGTNFVNTEVRLETGITPGGVGFAEINGVNVWSASGFSTNPTHQPGVRARRYGNGSNGFTEIDFIAVRKLSNTEPAFNTAGAEETLPSVATPSIMSFGGF